MKIPIGVGNQNGSETQMATLKFDQKEYGESAACSENCAILSS